MNIILLAFFIYAVITQLRVHFLEQDIKLLKPKVLAAERKLWKLQIGQSWEQITKEELARKE